MTIRIPTRLLTIHEALALFCASTTGTTMGVLLSIIRQFHYKDMVTAMRAAQHALDHDHTHKYSDAIREEARAIMSQGSLPPMVMEMTTENVGIILDKMGHGALVRVSFHTKVMGEIMVPLLVTLKKMLELEQEDGLELYAKAQRDSMASATGFYSATLLFDEPMARQVLVNALPKIVRTIELVSTEEQRLKAELVDEEEMTAKA